MIKKLESAGLGFYVKATETQEKLGEFTNCLIINCNDNISLMFYL